MAPIMDLLNESLTDPIYIVEKITIGPKSDSFMYTFSNIFYYYYYFKEC